MQNNFLHRFVLLLLLFVFFSSFKDASNRPFEGNNQVVFKLIHGNYLTEDRTKNNELFANIPVANAWEIFYIHYNKDSTVNIQSSTGHFLGYNEQDSTLRSNVVERENAQLFLLIPHKQFFEIKTNTGENVVVDELQLKVSSVKKAQLFSVKNYSTQPGSIYSLRKIKWGKFFLQFFVFVGVVFFAFKILKNKRYQDKASLFSVLAIGFILLYIIFNTKRWKDNKVIGSDVVVYYEYLPAAFIFNDLSFDFRHHLPEDFTGQIWVGKNEKTGKGVPKTSMGMAYMYLPFFTVGHIVAKLTNCTTYGYSEPYSMMLVLGCWLYAFLGLFYLRKILLNYYNDTVTSFTLISIGLATNLFYYVTIESGMSHGYSFFLIVVFIWNTIKWHQNQNYKTAIVLGFVVGLIALIRPTNALIAVFFIFYGIISFESIKTKLVLFWEKKTQLLLLIFCSVIVWLPQLFYWKYASGSWFYFSYGEEKFYFNNPHILDGLFSYRKGWLLYTPIMVFALIGITFLYRKRKELILPIIIFVILNTYVVYSWWCWWYGGGFGSRPMVDSYAIMAISLAAFFAFFEKKNKYFKIIPFLLVAFFVGLNLFQTQQTKTCLHWDSMTKETYWNNFTTLGYPPGIDDMMKPPNYENAVKGLEEYPEENKE